MTDHLRTERRDYRAIHFQECPDKFRTASWESRRLKKLRLVRMDAGLPDPLLWSHVLLKILLVRVTPDEIQLEGYRNG